MPGGHYLKYPKSTTELTEPEQTESSEASVEDRTVTKMVDWVLALDVSYRDIKTISKAYRNCNINECSLNQSLAYIKEWPLFADFEVKKTNQNHNPEVQLAIWESAAVMKKRHHGWSTSIPMPAVTIDGHSWRWYLVFVTGGDLVGARGVGKMELANILADHDGPSRYGQYRDIDRYLAYRLLPEHPYGVGYHRF